ncbi:ATP-binding cassette domain-containing protein [Plantactinospora sp. CA-294935]|uniref:ATP-binding cassette domain-containing protein n=1 Tax=Plantactinospora sp. CA-294935 TaxID=3240012 RepID=UPI003D8A4341
MAPGLTIEATGLAKAYGSVRVLTGIDLQVPEGSVFALLGPNGAGKTTTVRILATLVRPDGGQARVAGFDILRQRHQVRRRISLTGQYATIDELQTGEENLRMMGRLSGLSTAGARARARDLLDGFDLADAAGRRVGTYSGGMRRRLDLAAGLVGRPSVMFLDEPTTGLDPRSRQALWQVIGGLAESGVTILLTTQYLEEADRLADRIAVLDAGQVVAEDSPARLKLRFAEQRLSLTLATGTDFESARRQLGARVLRADPARLAVDVATDGTAPGIRGLLDEVDPGRTAVTRFAVRTATLDDVFLALTGHTAGRAEPAASRTEKEPARV